MHKKPLWLDCDGVLLNWIDPFLEYVKSPLRYNDLTQYDLSVLFGNDTARMVAAVNEFNSTPAYAELKPLVAPASLQQLKDAGYDLKVITQVDGEAARSNRLVNLDSVFGRDMFSGIVQVSRGTNKAEWLRVEEPYDVIEVVEDNPKFFEQAADIGGFKCKAIQHPYNRKELKALKNVPIYMDMAEVVRDLC